MSNSSMIFLIGFMGSGKSTLGRALSQQLKYDFVDTDEWISNRACKSIPEIFLQDGEEYFRRMEQECLHHLMHQQEMVIATGGGTPCFYDNLDLMLEIGTVIFLNPSNMVLMERLKEEQSQRPLIAGKSEIELKETIDSMLKLRMPFYEKANIVIDEKVNVVELLQALA